MPVLCADTVFVLIDVEIYFLEIVHLLVYLPILTVDLLYSVTI